MNRKQQGINFNDESQGNINVVQTFVSPELRDRSEAQLLKAVKNEVAGRLAQSLHNRVYIELDKAEDPSQVVPPWAVDVKLGDAPSQRCPEGTSILEIFDRPEIGGRLLVLGAPGSGKTTMLLQLAAELVKRATENAADPVPVLLNLSAWKAEFKDITSWMVANLELKGVRKDIAEKWIAEGRILPLLDGLDELILQRQETCVQALNAFLPNWSGIPLVVCSRLEKYQVYESNLGLNGAIILQSLTNEKIEKFLREAKCHWLWDAVRNDADVMDTETGLARSPLFLTLIVLASRELSIELWKQEESLAKRRQILFEVYITVQLKRQYVDGENSPITKPYGDDKTKTWLGRLATYLIEENRTEFLIEKLQPSLLEPPWQKFVFKLILALVVGPVCGLIGGLTFDRYFGTVIGLAVAIFAVVISGTGPDEIKTVESITFSWEIAKKKILQGLTIGFILGTIGGVFSGIIGGVVFGTGPILGIVAGVVGGGIGAMSSGLLAGLSESLRGAEIDIKTSDNQGIYQSIFNSTILGLMFVPLGISFDVLMVGGIVQLHTTFNTILGSGVGCGFLLGANNGGLRSAIQHFALRITLWIFGYSPWNYSKFLRYCTDRGFLQRVGGGYRFVHALLRDHFATEYGNLKDNNSQEK